MKKNFSLVWIKIIDWEEFELTNTSGVPEEILNFLKEEWQTFWWREEIADNYMQQISDWLDSAELGDKLICEEEFFIIRTTEKIDQITYKK